jgi:hypothetical protein
MVEKRVFSCTSKTGFEREPRPKKQSALTTSRGVSPCQRFSVTTTLFSTAPASAKLDHISYEFSWDVRKAGHCPRWHGRTSTQVWASRSGRLCFFPSASISQSFSRILVTPIAIASPMYASTRNISCGFGKQWLSCAKKRLTFLFFLFFLS